MADKDGLLRKDAPIDCNKHPLVSGVRYGVVHMREGFNDWNNEWKTAVAGQLILVDHSMLGIEKPGDTSWAIWVCDPYNHDVGIVIPGCQIRAVATMKSPPDPELAHQHCAVYGDPRVTTDCEE